MPDDAALIDHEDDRQRNAVPRARLLELGIGDTEGRNDLRLGVGQQRVADILGIGETLQLGRLVVSNKRDVIAERAKVLDAGVPGDRLDLAVGSPVEGAGKQDDQPPAVGQGFEILMLVVLVDGIQVMRNFRADRGAGLERVIG